MPRSVTRMSKGGPISVGLCEYDVSDVIHMNPFAVIGRLLGGCGICGTLEYGIRVQCLPGHGCICKACDEKYIEGPHHKTEDGRDAHYCLENPKHPYHWPKA